MIKIVGYGNGSGSQLYRMEQIFKYLNKTGGYQSVVSPNGVNDKELAWTDVIWPQATVDPRMIADIWAYQIEKNKAVLVDRDDSLYANDDNPFLSVTQEASCIRMERRAPQNRRPCDSNVTASL